MCSTGDNRGDVKIAYQKTGRLKNGKIDAER